MFKNYIIIGWRTLLRSKGFSIINISGLTVGMTVAILITLWVFDEVSANRNFSNYKNIGAVWHNLNFNGDIISIDGSPSYQYGQKLKSSFPEIEQAVMTTSALNHVVVLGDRGFTKKAMFVDPGFVDMFTVDIVQGSGAMTDPRSAIVSRTFAEALDKDVVGEMVRLDSRHDIMIAGVFEDFPGNSRYAEVSMLMPMDFLPLVDEASKQVYESSEAFEFGCLILTHDGIDPVSLNSKIRDVVFNDAGPGVKSLDPRSFVFPMVDWNLRANFEDGKNTGGKIQFVWMFGIVGAFVLLLACINFMNLSTARAEKRSKEVGVRKVMGSLQGQLIAQFLSESFIIVLIAFVASLLLVQLSLPLYNVITEKHLTIPLTQFWFVASCVVFIAITSLLAGSYPALYLASFKPVTVLKGTARVGRSNILSRKSLVIFQFTVSIAIIACTVLVFQQIDHVKARPLGFEKKNIIFIEGKTAAWGKIDFNLLRNDLFATGVVENMAPSDAPITGAMSANASTTWPGKDPAQQPLIAINSVSHDFPATNGFEILEGRDFSKEIASDSSAVLVNELAAELIAPGKSVLGVKIKWGDKEHEVVGVIRNQIRWGANNQQKPHFYVVNYKALHFITIRFIPTATTKDALEKVKAVIAKYDPGTPFDYTFVDDDYAKQFQTEERTANLAIIFATLAIFISIIGVLGLASFAAAQRTREIGIRKVLGASTLNVWRLLSTDFIVLILIAMAIATPLAWYFCSEWLSQYEYRIDISPWVFVFTCISVLTVTLFTVSYQAIAAAMVNPVNSLRSE